MFIICQKFISGVSPQAACYLPLWSAVTVLLGDLEMLTILDSGLVCRHDCPSLWGAD